MLVDDGLDGDPMAPLSHIAQKKLFDVDDRVMIADEFVKNLAAQGGKNTANLATTLLTDAATQGVNAAKAVPMGTQQRAMAAGIIANDSMLNAATDAEKDMLVRSFGTMQRVAPTLAGDEFAVRNYLRESLVASNGPDYGTIANLARAEQAINPPTASRPK